MLILSPRRGDKFAVAAKRCPTILHSSLFTLHSLCVCQVQIVSLCGIFCRQGVYLVDEGQDAIFLSPLADEEPRLFHVQESLETKGAGYLEVRKSIYLRLVEQGQELVFYEFHHLALRQKLVQLRQVGMFLHGMVDADDVPQLLQEPAVYHCQLVYLLYGISRLQCLCNGKDTRVGRMGK